MRYILITLGFCMGILYSGVFPAAASAHATGASLYATTSPYVIDVGYDPIQVFAGDSTRFDFILANESTGKSEPYAQVWIRIKSSERTLLATGIFRQPFGPTTLLYAFPEPGTYTIQPSYRDKDGNELAVASFPLTVTAPDEDASFLGFLSGGVLILVGVVLGVFITIAIARRSKRHQ